MARFEHPTNQQHPIQGSPPGLPEPARPTILDEELIELIENFDSVDDHYSISRIEDLLMQGASANAVASDGKSVLHCAVKSGRLEVVKALCNFQADCTVPVNNYGQTLLMVAAGKGHPNIVEFLVKAQAMDVDGADIKGWTALLYAVNDDDSNLATIKTLLELGADVNIHTPDDETPIGLAAWDGNEKVLKLLIRHGARVDPHSMALWHALQGSNSEIINILLDHGADPNTNGGDDSPLMQALKHRYFEIIPSLIAHNANVDWSEDQTASAWTHVITNDPPGMTNTDLLVARDMLISPRLPIFDANIADHNPRLVFQLIAHQPARAELSRNGMLSLCATSLTSELGSFTERLRFSNNDQPSTLQQERMLCAFLLATSPGLQVFCAHDRPNPYNGTSRALPQRLKQAMFEQTKKQALDLIAYGEHQLAKHFDTFFTKLGSAMHELTAAGTPLSGAEIRTLAQKLCENPGFPMRAAELIAHCSAAAMEAMQPFQLSAVPHAVADEFLLRMFSTLFSTYVSTEEFHFHGKELLCPGGWETTILEKLFDISAPFSMAAASLLQDPANFIHALCMKRSMPGGTVSLKELIDTICHETGIPYPVAIVLADAWHSARSGMNISSYSKVPDTISPVFSRRFARALKAAIIHSDRPIESAILRTVNSDMKGKLVAWCDAIAPRTETQLRNTAGTRRPPQPDNDATHPPKRQKTS